ncbi:class I SAM-dependent methyltransferase [Paenibacillus sp. Soil724D2]|uniref:class I SAM-dependent methyltransferase n=1 Tax=Paenibacillus sp. (strain Soil724D2) TaxID=1736392 RepID=UPI000712E25B|nr:hypothetical protein [Paenibacillus sp. Soil724D2]KRE51057.1 hypothetical protein ASG85_19055 [Paenibacillus sp. Soil724D2]
MKDFFNLDADIQADVIMDIIKKKKENRQQLLVKEEINENPLADLEWKIKELKDNSNTIPVPQNVRHRFIKRVIGKLIRTYTRQQVHFNQSITSLGELVLHHLQNMYARNKQDSNEVLKKIQYLEEKVRLLQSNQEMYISEAEKSINLQDKKMISFEELEIQYSNINELVISEIDSRISTTITNELEKFHNWIHNLNESYRKMDNSIDMLKDRFERIDQLNLWLKSLDESHKNLNKWVELISNRAEKTENFQDRIRKELFAEIKFNGTKLEKTSNIESRIINKTKYHNMVNAKDVRINLGSGTLVNDQYLNVDMRELEGVDVVADARNLPFPQNSVNELFLSHVIEHFSESEMRNNILPHWYSILDVGGKIKIICPNWESMLNSYASGEITYDELKEVTFGSQEYEGNFHFNMFTPLTLIALMEEIGFSNINVISESRKNGLCFEMEIEGERVK